MTQRFKVPTGDVPAAAIARHLGLSLDGFKEALPALLARTPPFPAPDPDTGNFDLDAVVAWRRARYPHLFSSSPAPAGARHARDVVSHRLRGSRDG